MTSAATPLSVARDARGVVTLTLNDPARFNALGSEMLTALQQALDAVAHDDSARVVVLAAEGKAFCAGHNLKDMAAHPELAWYQQLFSQCSRMMLSIHKLPVPVIARVQGMATAAGCQLVAHAPVLINAAQYPPAFKVQHRSQRLVAPAKHFAGGEHFDLGRKGEECGWQHVAHFAAR